MVWAVGLFPTPCIGFMGWGGPVVKPPGPPNAQVAAFLLLARLCFIYLFGLPCGIQLVVP